MNQRIPDNYDAWLAHDAALPVCDYCGEPVQEGYYYEIGGWVVCESCLELFFRRDIG